MDLSESDGGDPATRHATDTSKLSEHETLDEEIKRAIRQESLEDEKRSKEDRHSLTVESREIKCEYDSQISVEADSDVILKEEQVDIMDLEDEVFKNIDQDDFDDVEVEARKRARLDWENGNISATVSLEVPILSLQVDLPPLDTKNKSEETGKAEYSTTDSSDYVKPAGVLETNIDDIPAIHCDVGDVLLDSAPIAQPEGESSDEGSKEAPSPGSQDSPKEQLPKEADEDPVETPIPDPKTNPVRMTLLSPPSPCSMTLEPPRSPRSPLQKECTFMLPPDFSDEQQLPSERIVEGAESMSEDELLLKPRPSLSEFLMLTFLIGAR